MVACIDLVVNDSCLIIQTTLLFLFLRPFLDWRTKTNILVTSTVTTIIFLGKDFHEAEDNEKLWWGIMCTLIKSVNVSMLAYLCLRWQVPLFFMEEQNKARERRIRWSGIFICILILFASKLVNGEETSSITVPIISIVLLWYGSGSYMCKRGAIILTSIFLAFFVNSMGHDSRSTKTNFQDFFQSLLFNTCCVSIFCTLERCFSVILTFPDVYGDKTTLQSVLRAHVTLNGDLPQDDIHDIKCAIGTASNLSSNFAMMILFPYGFRTNMQILQAFSTFWDELIDSPSLTVEKKTQNLELFRQFVKHISTSVGGNISLEFLQQYFNPNDLACLRAVTKVLIRHIPRSYLEQLYSGFASDVDKTIIKDENDLIDYCDKVAGSGGTAVCHVFLRDYEIEAIAQQDNNIHYAALRKFTQHFGLYCQCVNIARDIVTDSIENGRVYVPKTYFDKEFESDFEALTGKDPWKVEQLRLKMYAMKILDLSEKMKQMGKLEKGFFLMPPEYSRTLYIWFRIYSSIGDEIKHQKGYTRKASTSRKKKLWTIFRSLYFPLYVDKEHYWM